MLSLHTLPCWSSWIHVTSFFSSSFRPKEITQPEAVSQHEICALAKNKRVEKQGGNSAPLLYSCAGRLCLKAFGGVPRAICEWTADVLTLMRPEGSKILPLLEIGILSALSCYRQGRNPFFKNERMNEAFFAAAWFFPFSEAIVYVRLKRWFWQIQVN